MDNLQNLPALKLDKRRSRVKNCPCGKSNKDGKFSPYIGFEDKGYCHSCGDTFLPVIESIVKNFYFVPFDNLIKYSDKAYQITTANGLFYLPKSVVCEVAEKGCYVAEWFLKEGSTSKKPLFLATDCKSFFDGEAVAPVQRTKRPNTEPKPVSFIDPDIMKASLKNYEGNHFVQYLISLFGNDVTLKLVAKYFIGTSNHWQGANIFWQIDVDRNIRTGKIMLYSPFTGKRVKEPCNHIAWVHTAINQPDFELSQCLSGSHLLQGNTKPVALCESEKTAILASVYFPQFTWLAAGGADGLSAAKCDSLNKHGKPVILFPDISKPKDGKQSTFEKWQDIASKYLLKYTFSELLESKASELEKKDGLDLADYLIKFDYREFKTLLPVTVPPPPMVIAIDPQITLMGEIYPPAPFEHFLLAHIRNDADGRQYDVLYSSDETAPPITQQTDEVRQLAEHYNITFVDAICDEVPCLVNVITLTDTWKEKVVAEPAAPGYSMEQLEAMAMLHFSRTMIKDKAAAKSNYFTAWATDMAAFIKAAGGTQKDFLNKICSYYDSTTK